MLSNNNYICKNMKAIQINTTVNLDSGLSVPQGAIVVIAEGYADVKSQSDGTIPAQIATSVYANEQAYADKKSPITDIADFKPVFQGLKLSLLAYQTETAETLLIDAVVAALELIYPKNIEVITL